MTFVPGESTTIPVREWESWMRQNINALLKNFVTQQKPDLGSSKIFIKMIDENGVRYEECIVGNIIGKHFYGQEKKIRYGTKQFSPGTKVHCAFIYGGAGHESIVVYGKPRK
jgi:hypothetical protein